jgi:hypothetical protein
MQPEQHSAVGYGGSHCAAHLHALACAKQYKPISISILQQYIAYLLPARRPIADPGGLRMARDSGTGHHSSRGLGGAPLTYVRKIDIFSYEVNE